MRSFRAAGNTLSPRHSHSRAPAQGLGRGASNGLTRYLATPHAQLPEGLDPRTSSLRPRVTNCLGVPRTGSAVGKPGWLVTCRRSPRSHRLGPHVLLGRRRSGSGLTEGEACPEAPIQATDLLPDDPAAPGLLSQASRRQGGPPELPQEVESPLLPGATPPEQPARGSRLLGKQLGEEGVSGALVSPLSGESFTCGV